MQKERGHKANTVSMQQAGAKGGVFLKVEKEKKQKEQRSAEVSRQKRKSEFIKKGERMSEKGVSRCKSRERRKEKELKKNSSEEGYLISEKSQQKSKKVSKRKSEKRK